MHVDKLREARTKKNAHIKKRPAKRTSFKRFYRKFRAPLPGERRPARRAAAKAMWKATGKK